MSKSISEKVYFVVTVHSWEGDDGRWTTRSLETSFYTYGDTQEESERMAGDANVLLVEGLKLQGLAALTSHLMRSGVRFSIGKPDMIESPDVVAPKRCMQRAA